MAEGLSWSVKLDDKITPGAKTAEKSVKALGDSMQKLKQSAEAVKGAGTSLSAFGKLTQAVGRTFGSGGVNALMSAARGAAAAGDQMRAVWAKIGPVVTAVGTAALAAGVALTGMAAAAVGAAAKGIADFAGDKRQRKFAFDQITGGNAEKVMARIRAAADLTKSTLSETMASFNDMLAAGFSLDATDRLFKQLSDLKTNNPAANIEGLVRAISQIKNTGKLQADELLQLSDNGLAADLVYQQLEKQLGKTRAEVKQLADTGKISADQALKAIDAALAAKGKGKPGELAGMAPEKGEHAAERLKQKFQDMVKVDFGPMERFFEKIEKALDGKGGAALARSFEQLFKALGKGLDSVSVEDITAAMTAAAKVVDTFAGAVKIAAGVWNFFGSLLGNGSERSVVASAAFDALTGAVLGFATGGLYQAIGTMSGFWDMMGSVMEGIGDFVEELWDAAKKLGSDIIDGIVQGIKKAAGAVADAVKSACKSALDAGKDVLDIGSPSKEFAKIGRWSMEGFARGVSDNAPTAAGAAAGAAGLAAAAGQAAAIGAAAAQSSSTTNNVNNSRTASVRQTFNGSTDPRRAAAETTRALRSLNYAGA